MTRKRGFTLIRGTRVLALGLVGGGLRSDLDLRFGADGSHRGKRKGGCALRYWRLLVLGLAICLATPIIVSACGKEKEAGTPATAESKDLANKKAQATGR